MLCLSLSLLLFAVEPAAGVEAKYQEYKQQALSEFVDEHGVVCNRDQSGNFIDQGDAPWRTSLLLFCLAVERDHLNCDRFLTALENCWREGKPVRHPSDKVFAHYQQQQNLYSRDQFWPQLAALYFCYRFGNEENKPRAKVLLNRFLAHLQANHWKFNEGFAAHLNMSARPGRYVLRVVGEQMELEEHWSKSPFQTWEYGLYRELVGMSLDLQTFVVKHGFRWNDFSLDRSNPPEFYAVHNLFWQILLIQECGKPPSQWEQRINGLAKACEPHNMALYLWLVDDTEKPLAWLKNWPEEWSTRDYVWQRTKKQNAVPANSACRSPRLDYMVLYSLFQLSQQP